MPIDLCTKSYYTNKYDSTYFIWEVFYEYRIIGAFYLQKAPAFYIPSMVMMVLTSVLWCSGWIFISNFIGAEPFAAVNIIMPFLMIFGAVGL